MSTINQAIDIQELINKLFVVLNDREQSVIIRRFGLENTNKETLEAIGDDLSITRERVRQIENFAIKKLQRMANNSEFKNLYEIIQNIVKQNGNIILESELINQTLQSMPEATNLDAASIRLTLEVNPDLQKIKRTKRNDKAWHSIQIDKNAIKTTISSAIAELKKAKDIITEKNLLQAIQSSTVEPLNPQTIKAILTIDNRIKLIKEGYGLTKWRHVQPKSIRDKALIVLRRNKKPLHFVEIANKITEADFSNKTVTTQAVHNELIRYPEFILVGRGLYALKEWGYQSGTVREVLTDILKDGEARKKQKIVEEVLERRHVKVGTISLNLQKYPEFERISRAVYRYNPNKLQD